MKLATFNANSIRARIEIVSDWLKNEQPDVLCLQETKVRDNEFPYELFEELDYQVVYKGQKSYNGVAIISRLPMDNIRLNLYDDDQARFVSVKISAGINISVINVYVPQGFAPGTDKFIYKLNWMEELLSHIKKEYNPKMPLLLVGDFNVALEPIDVYDPEGVRGGVGFHPDEQAVMGRLLDWGLVDIFRKYQPDGGHYTFWDYRIPNGFKRKMGWRIDYIFATGNLAEKSTRAWIDIEPRTREKPSDHTFLVGDFDI